MQRSTYASRPELLDRAAPATDIWPEYNLHGDVLNVYWPRLWERFGDFQFFLHDGEQVLVECCTVPCRWDGTTAGLPAGIDAVIQRAFDEPGEPDTLCALAAQVHPDARSAGLSRAALLAMRDVAAGHGLRSLIAPVRPSAKELYPVTPIGEYATWRRGDGLLFDPWMRTHERLGARLLGVCERSLLVTGTVDEWEEWTGLAFPASGEYVFPRGLATVRIDRDRDLGTYWEPNVWFAHDVSRDAQDGASG